MSSFALGYCELGARRGDTAGVSHYVQSSMRLHGTAFYACVRDERASADESVRGRVERVAELLDGARASVDFASVAIAHLSVGAVVVLPNVPGSVMPLGALDARAAFAVFEAPVLARVGARIEVRFVRVSDVLTPSVVHVVFDVERAERT